MKFLTLGHTIYFAWDEISPETNWFFRINPGFAILVSYVTRSLKTIFPTVALVLRAMQAVSEEERALTSILVYTVLPLLTFKAPLGILTFKLGSFMISNNKAD